MVATISERVARYLERQGWLARDEQSDHLALALEDEEGNTMQQLQSHSITYRIAMGPHAGRKVFTLQTISAWEEDDFGTDQLGKRQMDEKSQIKPRASAKECVVLKADPHRG